MKKINYFLSPIFAMSFFSMAAPAPTPPVRFAPATLGTTKYEIFSFTRFGVVPVGPELKPAEKRALVELVKAKDQAGLIVHSGTEDGQQFSFSLPPQQQKSYKVLAPKLLERLKDCIKSMPDQSALDLISIISGVEREADPETIAQVKADFGNAVATKCTAKVNDLSVKIYEERAMSGLESILTGEFSVWLGGENHILILQNFGDSIFGKQGIFADVAYDYLKTTMTETISGMGKSDGLALLSRPDGFSTFVDFLVVAKTKTSMPAGVLEAISTKCLGSVSDLFKPFSLQTCGSDLYSVKTIAIGEIEGSLVTGEGGI